MGIAHFIKYQQTKEIFMNVEENENACELVLEMSDFEIPDFEIEHYSFMELGPRRC